MKARVLILLSALLVLTARGQTQGNGWRSLAVPGTWDNTAGLQHDGFAWYRCFVKVPAEWAGQSVTLAVESVDNAHEAYFNGAKVGGAGHFPPDYQNGLEAAGRYSLPTDKLRAGEWNLVAIRVFAREGRGGFKGAAPVIGTDKQHITLAGTWEFRTGNDPAWAGQGLPGFNVQRPTLNAQRSTLHQQSAISNQQSAINNQNPLTPSLSPAPSGGEGARRPGEVTATLAATFTKVADGPAPKPSGGHKMSDRSTPLPPAEAAKTFSVPDDLEFEQVLAEPIVRQPVFLNFDERGRMWVVQYIQYPSPAGLKVVSKDQFWRAIYDKVPESPPRGVRGLDKITIHEDTDGDGVFDKHKTFVEGLNIATACVKGRGGLWVLNPPYLLFYPDQNDDDVPDGDPVVHLEGFGLEDTHSVVNSLRWGPDGWLYAAQGSTVTANVRVRVTNGVMESWSNGVARTPALQHSNTPSPHSPRSSTRSGEPPVYSQGQNIWRYHPEKHIYEIFAEGGGNAFGVEFDDKGRLFSGHNGGDTRGFHYMQGAYLRKGFEKHGELSNPYAFGYFPQMDGTKGERFTHNFIIYHGGALPPRYEGKLFGIEPLQGRVVLSEITPDGSTFRTRDLERVVTSSDSWFRPVDIKTGPDGAIYIADWYNRQVTHTRNQEGNIDASNGRIYRLKKKGAKPAMPLKLRELGTSAPGLLGENQNEWVRQTALRLLADRRERKAATQLRNFLVPSDIPEEAAAWKFGPRPSADLELLWALYLCGGWDEKAAINCLSHRDPFVRHWSARLLGDERQVSPALSERLAALAATETNVEVRAQLACTAKRLPARDAMPIVHNLILSSTRTRDPGSAGILPASASDEKRRQDAGAPSEDDARDSRLPLLLWWAIESNCESGRDAVLELFADSPLWSRPIVEQHILGRLMRRFAAAGTRRDLLTCARLLELSPSRAHSEKLMKGFEEAFKGRSAAGLPEEFIKATLRHEVGSVAFKVRQGQPEFLPAALKSVADPGLDREQRRQYIEVLGEVHPREALDPLLRIADAEKDPQLRKAALTALLGYDDPRIPATVLRDYAACLPEVRPVALTLLASRSSWSLALAEAVEAGRLKPADVPLDTVRQLQRHKSDKLAALLSKYWPNAGRPTTQEMQQQIQRFSSVLHDGKGDPYAGQKLFNASCASCHTLFARGGQVGPDLTAYQRGDLDAMLLHIVNPSAEIREGYESLAIEMKDDRSLTGFLVERDGNVVVIRGPDGQNIALDQKDITEMKGTGLSLMPEGLLDHLDGQQVRDLFAYLRSTQPLAN